MNHNYGNDSITQLKGADRLRLRPEALLGSKGIEGAQHTVIEIVGNSTDERLSGFGDKIIIGYHEDGSISVRDFGRGVPLGWNEKEKNWNYFLIYEELYAGGKYSKNQDVLSKINEAGWNGFRLEDYPNLVTIGLNGLGAASTQYTSEFFTVISYRDGKASRMDFKKGVHVLDELMVYDTDEPNGTYIHWKPDREVFTDVDIPVKWFEKLCRSLSYVSGFEVIFNNRGVEEVFHSSSIADVVKEATGSVVSTHDFTHITDSEGDICICDVDIAIGPKGAGTEYFHNRVEVTGGSHALGYFSALSDFFAGISTKENVRIRESDYAGKFSCFISTLANKSSLRNQTKDSIDDFWIMQFIRQTLYTALRREEERGTEWLENIIAEVIQDAKNRIAVAEMSKNLKEIQQTTKRHKVSGKFSTCRSYEDGKAEETEFLIVEGDSAGGQVIKSRDSRFQCVLPIRGKSLNVYKASIEKLIANREIRDIVSVLGCGVDLGIDDFETFNMGKLKVGKIIFCADADADGSHINMLLCLIIWKLFPELLYSGKVYIAETPLYIINKTDGSTEYCMDNADLAKKREEVGESNIASIDRFKGLGEVDSDILWDSTLNPATRRLKQVKIDRGDTDMYDVLEVLFGKSTDRRKQAILGGMLGADFNDTLDEMTSVSEYIDSLGFDSDLVVEEVEM